MSDGGIPADRYAARLAAARREARDAGLDALLVGVGADLRYLAGYEAMPLERLTMLVLPAVVDVPTTLVAPRLEATPARTCPAAASGSVEVATWRRRRPMSLVAPPRRGGRGRPGSVGRSPSPTACGRRSCWGSCGVPGLASR